MVQTFRSSSTRGQRTRWQVQFISTVVYIAQFTDSETSNSSCSYEGTSCYCPLLGVLFLFMGEGERQSGVVPADCSYRRVRVAVDM